MKLFIASGSRFREKKQWSNLDMPSNIINCWSEMAVDYLNLLKYLTTAVRCFDTEKLYSWGIRCHVWIEAVTALLPLNWTRNLAALSFVLTLNSSYSEVSSSADIHRDHFGGLNLVFISLYIEMEIVTSSTSVIIRLNFKCEKLLRAGSSLAIEQTRLQIVCNDHFQRNNLFIIDIKILKCSLLSSDVLPNDDERCFKSTRLVLHDFLRRRKIFLRRAR